MLKINAGKLIKRIITILVSFLLISCEDKVSSGFELEFDMRLSQDDNGYYHLPINTENWQTLHKVSGLVMKNDYGVENF